jgi:hypothetical protein
LSLGPRSGGRHRARRAPQQMGLTVSITEKVFLAPQPQISSFLDVVQLSQFIDAI